jgi:hypothetical protein
MKGHENLEAKTHHQQGKQAKKMEAPAANISESW